MPLLDCDFPSSGHGVVVDSRGLWFDHTGFRGELCWAEALPTPSVGHWLKLVLGYSGTVRANWGVVAVP